MKTTIAAIVFGTVLIGNAYAGHKHCRNNFSTCKCKCNYTTTLFSTGRYRVDVSKGPIWINFNPRESGKYEIKIYKKTLAMSLTQCGKAGYVRSVWKKDDCSNSFIADLSNKATYRLYLNRAKRSDKSMIVVISRLDRDCSRVKRITSDCSEKIRDYLDSYSSRSYSCRKPSYKYYYKNGCFYRRPSVKRYYYSGSETKKCSSKSGISFSFSF